MKRIAWLWCLLIGGWGCTDWTKAEALLPQPPLQKLEAVVDSSGERRLIALYPEKDGQLSLVVLSPSSVVKTLKKRFPKDTTIQQLQLLRRENDRWVFFQAFDAKRRVDHYWDVDKNEFYSRAVPLAGGERTWSKTPPKDHPVQTLMVEREIDEQREVGEKLRACLERSTALKDEDKKRLAKEFSLLDAQRLQVDGQPVLVGMFSAEPTRVVLCREAVSSATQLVSLLPIEETCMNFGSADRIWFADVAPSEGSELLAQVMSTNCTGTHGHKAKLAIYSSPLDGTKTRQIFFETQGESVSGIHGYVEVETDFKFTGQAGGYSINSVTTEKNNDGDGDTQTRTRRTYVWSKSKERFVKKTD
ncbi:hypothetical protein F0U61_24710 [Archangium violaceum]|uniref:hypothetical protein n=1 Tax=Archangium violaceum TaxID=83451 RepID=UPI002B29D8F4|nr:hypothetical protein F0U61_24710 [Archangium violaceum]